MISSTVARPHRRAAGFASRSIAALLILAGGSNSLAQSSSHDTHGEDCNVSCAKGRAMRSMYDAGLAPDGTGAARDYGSREALTATDLLTAKLDLEVVPGGSPNLIGTSTMTVKSLVNGLTTFTIQLRWQYTVTTCTVDGLNASIARPAVGTNYANTITLPRTYNAGETFTVVIAYNGVAANVGLGSISFGTMGGQSAVFSLSEPYYAGTWWPIKDGGVREAGDNSDKFLPEVWITAPTALTSVSNGVLQGIDAIGATKRRFRWKSNIPIAPYLVAFGTASYNTWIKNYTYPLPGGGTGTMPGQFFISPSSDTPENRAGWEASLNMMAGFRPYYGEYPFVSEKYGIYQFTFGGGMEHQTMTGQNSFGEDLTSHELAHQWWGDNVTCRFWNDIWLNEGFATFSEALWLEKKPGSSGTPALLSAMAARRPSDPTATVYVYDITNPNNIFSSNAVYDKGGWVLHMLRRVMGDAAFFAGVQNYRAAFEGGAATTNDFASIMSTAAGQDLSWFFNQWVFNGGAPVYQYAWSPFAVNGQNYIQLMIKQTQAGSPFRMPQDVRVTWSGGNATYLVQNSLATQYYVVPVGGVASAVALDPSDYVLDAGTSTTTLTGAPPVVLGTSPVAGLASTADITSAAFTFSGNVSAVGSQFTVTGPSGSVPFSYTYNATTFRATLTFASPLPAGTYTVTALDTITRAAIRLDGEVANPASPASFPTGNGVAGGNATFTFTVVAQPPICIGDFDNSGGTPDAGDVDAFFTAWLAGDASADVDNSGGTPDAGDVDTFFTAWLAGC
jgi:aminopeptidase N